MTRRRGAAVVVRLALAAAATLLAAGALALSLVPHDELERRLDAASVDGDADVSRAQLEAAVLAARVAAALLAAAAAGLVLGGRWLDPPLGRVLAGVARGWRGWRERTLAAVRAEERAHVAALAAVVVVGAALRAAYLGLPLRYDEATTFNNFASKPLYIALSNYATPNNHLLHTLLVHVSTGLLGAAEWAIRLPAFVAGLLLVPATYLLARRLYGRGAGLAAAALASASPPLVVFSANARGYTLVALASVLLLLAAPAAFEREPPHGRIALGVVAALGLWAVPVMALPLGGVALWVLARSAAHGRPPPAAALRRLAGFGSVTALVAGLLYLPVVVASGPAALASNEYVEPRAWGAFLGELPDGLAETWSRWTAGLPESVAVLLAAAAGAGVLLHGRLSREPIPPLLPTLAWALALVLARRVVPFPRVWLFLLPLVLAAAAAALAAAAARAGPATRAPAWAGPSAAVASAAVLAVALASSGAVREDRETGALLDAPAVAELLAPRLRPGDGLVATGSDTILEYYLRRQGVEPRRHLYEPVTGRRVYLVVSELGGKTLADLRRSERLGGARLGSVRTLARYPSATVYEATREGAAPA